MILKLIFLELRGYLKKLANKKFQRGLKLTKKFFKRIQMAEKYYPVVQTYIKQRIFIRIKYLNKHTNILNKKIKAKFQLQRLQKLKRLMT